MEETKVTDLDQEGAVIWTSCHTCGANRNVFCKPTFLIGPFLIISVLDPGKVHDTRMQDWLRFKSRVVAGAKVYRRPNLQQIPRKKNT